MTSADDISITGQPNTIALIVRSMIFEFADRAPLPDPLSIGLDIDGQCVTIRHSGGSITVGSRSTEGARAVFTCGLQDFVEAVINGHIIGAVMAGKLTFRGNPLEALKSYFWLRKICRAL